MFIEATEYVTASLEISRQPLFADWDIPIQESVTDNASCGIFTIGTQQVDPPRH